jgi:uncharacterized membrane protein YphA (DoxX/SURF4 family)
VSFLLKLHGELRWLVALVGLIALVRLAFGHARGAEFKGADRALVATFGGLLDLDMLLGLVLLFALGGGFPSHRVEHAVTMLVAIVVVHATQRWRGTGDSARRFRANLAVVAAALALVLAGVLRLRGGWVF